MKILVASIHVALTVVVVMVARQENAAIVVAKTDVAIKKKSS